MYDLNVFFDLKFCNYWKWFTVSVSQKKNIPLYKELLINFVKFIYNIFNCNFYCGNRIITRYTSLIYLILFPVCIFFNFLLHIEFIYKIALFITKVQNLKKIRRFNFFATHFLVFNSFIFQTLTIIIE